MLYYFHLYVEVGYFSVNLVRVYLAMIINCFLKLTTQLAGIQIKAVMSTTTPTMLSRRKPNTLLILMSSIMSQNRSTTSWIVFSQTPCNKSYFIISICHLFHKQTLCFCVSISSILLYFFWWGNYFIFVWNYDNLNHYLIAKPLNTGCSVWKYVILCYWEASLIETFATATFARIRHWKKNSI